MNKTVALEAMPELSALTRRSGRWGHEVLRLPTSAMAGALIHVAIATFSQPRGDLSSGRQVGWVIVVDEADEEVRVRCGLTDDESPGGALLENLAELLNRVTDSVWVSLPRKRKGLALQLQAAGYDVTIGFGVGSRAEPLLRERLATQIAHARLDAERAQATTVRRRGHAQERPPEAVVHWLPAEWRLGRTAKLDTLRLATDGSLEAVDYSRVFAVSVVSDDGDCVLDSGFTQGNIGQTEFLAIVYALELIVARGPRHASIVSDSREAIAIAEALTADPRSLRFGWGAGRCMGQYRQRFTRAWRSASARTRVSISHVRGHTGHVLNEAADEVASMARRAAMISRSTSEGFLIDRIDEVLREISAEEESTSTAAALRPATC